MEKLMFQLYSNNNKTIDLECNYVIKDNIYKFKIDENINLFDNNKHILTKKMVDGLLRINMHDSNMIYTLGTNGKDYILSLKDSKLLLNDKSLEYYYSIPDNGINNKIIIKWDY